MSFMNTVPIVIHSFPQKALFLGDKWGVDLGQKEGYGREVVKDIGKYSMDWGGWGESLLTGAVAEWGSG